MHTRFELLAALGVAAGLGACSSSVTLDLDLADDELAIIATVDESGRVLYADKVRRGAVTVAAPTNAHLFVWTLDIAQLVGPDGTPLAEDALDTLTIAGRESEELGPTGACGRCLVPADASPQVLQSGDSCAVPSFAKLDVFRVGRTIETSTVPETLAESVRTRVRMTVPGDCACDDSIPEGATDNELEVCAVLPEDSRFDFNSGGFAVDEAGWFAAFANRIAVIVAPDGRQFIDEQSEPLLGPALGAVPLATSSVSEGGRFLIFSRRLRSVEIDNRADLVEVVGDQIRRTTSVIPQGELISVEFAETISPGRRVILAGNVNKGILVEPAIALLEIEGDRFSLTQELVLPGDCPFSPSITTLRAATETDSGLGAAISFGGRVDGDPGSLYIRPVGSSEWRCAAKLPTTYQADGTEGALTELQTLGTINNRLVVVSKGRRDGRSELVSFLLDPTTLTDSSAIDGWTPNIDGDTYRTSGFIQTIAHVPGTPLLRAVIWENRMIDLLGELMADQPLVSRLPGFGSVTHKPRGYFTSRSGWEVVRGVSEAFYRRPPGGEAERILGPSRNTSSQRVFLAEGFGAHAIAVFTRGQPPVLIDERAEVEGCTRFEPHAVDMEPPIPSSEALMSATLLSDGRYLVATREAATPSTYILRWVDLDRRTVDGELRVPQIGLVQQNTPGVQLNENVFLFTDNAARVFALRDPTRAENRTPAEVVQLDPVWDDPSTSVIESEPDSTGGSSPGFRHMTVSHGVAWATGNNLLARIVPGSGDALPRLEGYWRWRADAGAFGEFPAYQGSRPYLHSALAVCPDRVSFTTNWTALNLSGSSYYSIGAWRLMPARECTVEDREDLLVCPHPIYQSGLSYVSTPAGGATGIYTTERGLYQLLGSNGFLVSSAGYYPLTYGAVLDSHEDREGRLWYRQDNSERVGVVVPRP